MEAVLNREEPAESAPLPPLPPAPVTTAVRAPLRQLLAR